MVRWIVLCSAATEGTCGCCLVNILACTIRQPVQLVTLLDLYSGIAQANTCQSTLEVLLTCGKRLQRSITMTVGQTALQGQAARASVAPRLSAVR